MKDIITVNGKKLDLSPKSLVNLNMQINDIGDISTRNSSYSNTITIPKTSRNQEIFEMLGMIGATTRLPYTKVPCKYSRDGVTIIKSGYLQVTDIGKDSFKAVMYDGIIDLDILLGEKTVLELDYSASNHYLNSVSDVTDTFNNTWADGYIYGMAHFGKDYITTSPDPASCEKLAPSVFAKSVFKKIFEDLNYTTTGFFDEPNVDWEQLVLPPTKGIDITEVALNEDPRGTNSSDALDVSVGYLPYGITVTPIVFSTDTWSNITLSAGSLVIGLAGLYEFNFTSTYTKSTGTNAPALSMRIYVNDVLSRTLAISEASPVTHTSQILDLVFGDEVRAEIVSVGYYDSAINRFNSYNYTHTASLQINSLSGGTLVELENYMSTDLKQKDFLKEIMQRFGVVMIRNSSDTTSYHFVSMETLLSDTENAVDWTDKLVSIENEELKPEGYAKSNDADYKYSEQDVIPFMNGSLLVNNENLGESKNLFTSSFEIPITYYWTIGANPLYSLPIWEYNDDTLAYDNVDNAVGLMRVITDPNSNVVYFNIYESSPAVSETDVALLSLVDMDYQYFFDTYYVNFKAMLDDYKKAECIFNLTPIDFSELDFTKLIYLKQTGQYYYLNSVKSSGSLSKVELIETNN